VTQDKVQVLVSLQALEAATKARARVAQRKVINQKTLRKATNQKTPRIQKLLRKMIKRPRKTKKIKRTKRKRRNQNPKAKWALSKIK